MKMKSLIVITILAIVLVSCNKEDPITPSAGFTTDIENNTLQVGEGFRVFVEDVTGEFRVYFRGNNLQSTFDADDPTRLGTPFGSDVRSLNIPGYSAAGEYTFTVVASSTGNWAQDFVRDVQSIAITVVE